MSVQSHLVELKNDLVLSSREKENIDSSIRSLSTRINSYFNGEVTSHFKFGSSTRGTILPRYADPNSDIDYMVVFKNPNDHKPQSLLNNLRRFANYYYSTSNIKQSHPTMVLELNHIRFELVPAKKDWLDNFHIPSPASEFTDWTRTYPNDFNEKITLANVRNNSLIKPLVRIMKYWNAQNGYYYSSYFLENEIAEKYYFSCDNLKEYVYRAFEDLRYNWNAPQIYKDRIDRTKKIIAETKDYEKKDMPVSAELEIKKILPSL